MEYIRTCKFQNCSSIHSQGKLQLAITKFWLQPTGSYNFVFYRLQLNGSVTPPFLQHPLEGAPTHNKQATTCFDTHCSIFNPFSYQDHECLLCFSNKLFTLYPLKNHLQQSLITVKNTTSPYQHLATPEALSQNQLVHDA